MPVPKYNRERRWSSEITVPGVAPKPGPSGAAGAGQIALGRGIGELGRQATEGAYRIGSAISAYQEAVAAEQLQARWDREFGDLTARKESLLYGENGYTTLKGENAIKAHGKLVSDFNSQLQERLRAVEAENNPHVTRRFSSLYDSFRQQFAHQVNAHLAEQSEVAYEEGYKLARQALTQNIVRMAGEGAIEDAKHQVDILRARIQQDLKIKGVIDSELPPGVAGGDEAATQLHDEIEDAEVDRQVTEVYVGVATLLMQQGKTEQAAELLDQLEADAQIDPTNDKLIQVRDGLTATLAVDAIMENRPWDVPGLGPPPDVDVPEPPIPDVLGATVGKPTVPMSEPDISEPPLSAPAPIPKPGSPEFEILHRAPEVLSITAGLRTIQDSALTEPQKQLALQMFKAKFSGNYKQALEYDKVYLDHYIKILGEAEYEGSTLPNPTAYIARVESSERDLTEQTRAEITKLAAAARERRRRRQAATARVSDRPLISNFRAQPPRVRADPHVRGAWMRAARTEEGAAEINRISGDATFGLETKGAVSSTTEIENLVLDTMSTTETDPGYITLSLQDKYRLLSEVQVAAAKMEREFGHGPSADWIDSYVRLNLLEAPGRAWYQSAASMRELIKDHEKLDQWPTVKVRGGSPTIRMLQKDGTYSGPIFMSDAINRYGEDEILLHPETWQYAWENPQDIAKMPKVEVQLTSELRDWLLRNPQAYLGVVPEE